MDIVINHTFEDGDKYLLYNDGRLYITLCTGEKIETVISKEAVLLVMDLVIHIRNLVVQLHTASQEKASNEC